MTERLLQYIWQFQYLNKIDLQTTSGEAVQIIFQGQHNTNQGGDKPQTNTAVDGIFATLHNGISKNASTQAGQDGLL